MPGVARQPVYFRQIADIVGQLATDPITEVPPALRAVAQREGDLDLLGRILMGSFIYPAMLLFVGFTTPYCSDHPRWFWGIVAATAVAISIRIAVNRFREQLYRRGRNVFLIPLFVSLGLSSAAAGCLLLSLAMDYGFASRPFALIIMWMAGIASGSTIVLTPNFPLLVMQLSVMLGPVIVYEFLLGSSYGWSFGVATLIFYAFHVVQGRRLNGMYWDLSSRRVLEKLYMAELEAAKATAENAQAKLQHQATHDTLTGLMNHARILTVMDQELDRAVREGKPFGIVLLDLDYFKEVNDQFGHLAGDEVLRKVAERVWRTVRSYDSVGRYGGEEFLVVLPGCSVEDCAASAERLRRAIEICPVEHRNIDLRITASLGVAVCDPRSDTGHRELIGRADRALYRAKRNGKNRVEVDSYDSSMVPILIERARA